jgi:hypothetical protein
VIDTRIYAPSENWRSKDYGDRFFGNSFEHNFKFMNRMNEGDVFYLHVLTNVLPEISSGAVLVRAESDGVTLATQNGSTTEPIEVKPGKTYFFKLLRDGGNYDLYAFTGAKHSKQVGHVYLRGQADCPNRIHAYSTDLVVADFDLGVVPRPYRPPTRRR